MSTFLTSLPDQISVDPNAEEEKGIFRTDYSLSPEHSLPDAHGPEKQRERNYVLTKSGLSVHVLASYCLQEIVQSYHAYFQLFVRSNVRGCHPWGHTNVHLYP